MANPVLNDKRFTATADELEPGWAAPTRTGSDRVPPAPGAPPTAARCRRTAPFAKTFFLWILLARRRRVRLVAGDGRLRPAPSAPGLDLDPAARGVRARDGVHLRPEDRARSPRRSTRSPRACSSARSRRPSSRSGTASSLQAVLATLAVFFVCLALYVFGVVKVTNKFIFVVIGATAGIFVLYLVRSSCRIFGVDITFWNEPSPLGIGISVVICFVAALNLFLDFEFIRRMVGGRSAEADGVVRRVRHHGHARVALPRDPAPALEDPRRAPPPYLPSGPRAPRWRLRARRGGRRVSRIRRPSCSRRCGSRRLRASAPAGARPARRRRHHPTRFGPQGRATPGIATGLDRGCVDDGVCEVEVLARRHHREPAVGHATGVPQCGFRYAADPHRDRPLHR